MRFYLPWCAAEDVAPMERQSLNAWEAAILEGGAAASTARSPQLAGCRFSAQMAEEGEIPIDPLLGLKSPTLEERLVEPLTDSELRHTAAHRWFAAGASQSGLMVVAGWTRLDILMRRTKTQVYARAAEEPEKLNSGEL